MWTPRVAHAALTLHREQHVTRVGSLNAAEVACPVNRNAVIAEFFAPEHLFNLRRQTVGLREQISGQMFVSKPICDLGDRTFGGDDIGLHLDQRDRSLGEAAIRVKY